jgi:hypothetical protein
MKKLIEYLSFFDQKHPTDKILMASAISDGNLDEIQRLHKKGVKFTEDKVPYSHLFQKKDPKFYQAQQYVVNNIEDIAFGKQVILRTLLHPRFYQASSETIKIVLDKYVEQYTSEQIVEMIPIAFGVRYETADVLIVKQFYEHQLYKKRVDDLAIELENQSKGKVKTEKKRLKI